MNKDDLIKEQFKQALNSTIKAISGETYSLKDKKNFIKLRPSSSSYELKRKFS